MQVPSGKILAVGYCRVSTQEQVAGYSLEAQTAHLRAYAALRDIDFVEIVWDPGISAGTPLRYRPGGRRIAELLRESGARVVAAAKVDRMFRDVRDCLDVADEWTARGVALHLLDVAGNTVDVSTAAGRFMLTMLASSAEFERRRISERTRIGLAVKKARGERIGRHAPFGYQVGPDGVHLEPCAREIETVRRIAQMLEDDPKLGYQTIGKELARVGILSRSDRRYSAQQVKNVVLRVIPRLGELLALLPRGRSRAST